MSRTSQESTVRAGRRGSRIGVTLIASLVVALVLGGTAFWFLTARSVVLRDGSYSCRPAGAPLSAASVVATVETGRPTRLDGTDSVGDTAPIRAWSDVSALTAYRFDMTVDEGEDPPSGRYECAWSARP